MCDRKTKNFKFFVLFLLLNFPSFAWCGDLYFKDFFDMECSPRADIGLILEMLENFQPESCRGILNIPLMDSFQGLLHCCDDLNDCYSLCDKSKKFCDDLLLKCFEFQCNDNIDDNPDKYLRKQLCLMVQDYHYTYKTLYGCEYFYYFKNKNNCFYS